MTQVEKPRVIILDRDGIINQDSPNYIKSVDEFIFLPGSINAIARLTQAGYKIGIATNQSGIARGYYSEDTLKQIHATLRAKVSKHGGRIDEIAYCPHAPIDACNCRKPKPGMLLYLAEKFAVANKDLIFVGDKRTDIEAAIAIGAKPMLVYSAMTEENIADDYKNLDKFNSLAECVDYLLT